MELQTIKTELAVYIRQQYRVPDDDPDFSDHVHLYDYGYVDSFGAVKLISFLQSRFAVTFTPTDLANVPLRTVDEFASFIVRRKKGEI